MLWQPDDTREACHATRQSRPPRWISPRCRWCGWDSLAWRDHLEVPRDSLGVKDSTPPVQRATSAGLPAAIIATSRAFYPDPLFGFFAKTATQEHHSTPVFIQAIMRDVMKYGEVSVVEIGGRVAGAAAWLPPGATPLTGRRRARVSLATSRALVKGRNRRIGLRLLDEVARSQPTEPHWYLALLGIDPAFQRRGLGGALLAPQLSECDATSTSAFLETQKVENLVFYERFGFRVLKEISVPSSPNVWQMWREPKII